MASPEIDVDDVSRWVFVGTGRLLDNTDMADTQQQTMYAFRDGTKTTPSTITTPLTRANLTAVTNLLSGVTYIPGQEQGWYYDLPGLDASTGGRERINLDVVTNNGNVSWVGSTPQSSNACVPSATSTLYTTGYSTAMSVLTSGVGGARVASISSSSATAGTQFVNDGSSRVVQLAIDATGQIAPVPGDYGGWSGTPRRVSWREIIRE
jgi:type IV pilus assembly protein PilY1